MPIALENTNEKQEVFFPSIAKNRIIKAPVSLLSRNIIGPPSVTMVHKTIIEKYDERMKWRVDIDFYIRVLMNEKHYSYINEVLVNVGVSESQVTNFCLNIPAVEIPEGYLLLEKYGIQPLRNILVFDAWWRIIRNLDITKKEQLEAYGQKKWPKVILNMVQLQSYFSNRLLKIGVVSKLVMFYAYCINLIQSNI